MAQKITALQTLEWQLREAQALAHFGSWEWDLRADRITWSPTLYEMMGVDSATFRPSLQSFLASVHPEDRERVERAADASREEGKPYSEPIRIVRPDGSVRTIRGASHPVTDAAGRPVRVVGVLQDISDEVQAQEGLRSYAEQVVVLARRLVEVQEIQGRRLANELHDNLGPTLTALSINLQLIEMALPAALRQTLAGTLADSREQVQAASAAMRDVMGELRPPGLDDHGLPAALRMLAAAFEKRTGIRATVSEGGSPCVSDRFALPLYRIAQEALNNIAKHSQARSVQIRCCAGGNLLEVEDDGVGFELGAPPPGPARAPGWGLLTMRERAAAVGASCEVLSQSGRGVLVRVAIGAGAW
ncbi:MAG TPA: PAS domain-containing protein [Burkholderiales bacterium]|nr:PAS domain-containing protein [Burkholderiales bacterium]